MVNIYNLCAAKHWHCRGGGIGGVDDDNSSSTIFRPNNHGFNKFIIKTWWSSFTLQQWQSSGQNARDSTVVAATNLSNKWHDRHNQRNAGTQHNWFEFCRTATAIVRRCNQRSTSWWFVINQCLRMINYIYFILAAAAVPPPSYDSIYGRVREAQKQSKGVLDFMKNIFVLLLGTSKWVAFYPILFDISLCTVGCTIILGITIVIPMCMITFGSYYLHRCPQGEFIPIYLLIGGKFQAREIYFLSDWYNIFHFLKMCALLIIFIHSQA